MLVVYRSIQYKPVMIVYRSKQYKKTYVGCLQVYTVQTNPLSRRLVQSYVDANQLQSSVRVLEKSVEDLNENDFDSKKVIFV